MNERILQRSYVLTVLEGRGNHSGSDGKSRIIEDEDVTKSGVIEVPESEFDLT